MWRMKSRGLGSLRTLCSVGILALSAAAAYASCGFAASTTKACAADGSYCVITICVVLTGTTEASVSHTVSCDAWIDPDHRTPADPPGETNDGYGPKYDSSNGQWYSKTCWQEDAHLATSPVQQTLTLQVSFNDGCGTPQVVTGTAPPAP
jgi:hypothetical protein